jgi:ABC-2 type transport system permease protein
MNNFASALFVETLKMRRSKVPYFTALGFCIAPLAGGLFMVILKDPEAAKTMGLISAKAQLMVGVADWPTYFNFMAQAVAAGGMVLFSIVTVWVFGREFSDHTVKELLALPTRRETVIAAKFVVMAVWSFAATALIFGISLAVGKALSLPGWSTDLFRESLIGIIGAALLTIPLMSFVALFASSGRGYMPAFGWTILTLITAQFAAILGWGDWFPWAIPALFSGAAGSRSEQLGLHSYIILTVATLIGFIITFWWWRDADQTR